MRPHFAKVINGIVTSTLAGKELDSLLDAHVPLPLQAPGQILDLISASMLANVSCKESNGDMFERHGKKLSNHHIFFTFNPFSAGTAFMLMQTG